ncbi:MAG: ATP-binding protein [Nitrospirales bacterium]|nr:response regulator [Nitrospira sp.]MDR4502588.1 ATP-binding protein [Nitrospirales bacterium]
MSLYSNSAGHHILTLEDVSYHGETFPPILREISFSIPQGAIVAIASENPDESSALLQILSGHLNPTQGSVQYLHDLHPTSSEKISISGIFGDLGYYHELSLFDNLFLGVPLAIGEGILNRNHLRKRAQDLYDELGQELEWERPSTLMSRKERVIASLVRGFLCKTSLYILNGVFQDLDEHSNDHLFKKIVRLSQQGITFVFSTEKYDETISHATHLAVLSGGNLRFFGQATELTAQQANCLLVKSVSDAKLVLSREFNRLRYAVKQPHIFIKHSVELLSYFHREEPLLFCYVKDSEKPCVLSHWITNRTFKKALKEKIQTFLIESETPPEVMTCDGMTFSLFTFSKTWENDANESGSAYRGILAIRQQEKGYVFPFQTYLRELEETLQALLEDLSLEQRLKHGQRLDSLGMLAGGVAHDFNNSLCALLGAAQLIQAGNTNPSLEPYLATVIDAAHDAKAFTKKLLSFSKKGGTTFTHVDLHEIISDAILFLRRGSKKKAHFHLKLLATNSCLMGDSAQLKNMLVNLGINAIQAVDGQNGKIYIKTFNSHFFHEDHSSKGSRSLRESICLEVTDNGPGINPDQKERIFEPFFSTKSSHEGTGLGLSVVYGTVKEHGGTIKARNQKKGGACFLIEFLTTEPLQKMGAQIFEPTLKMNPPKNLNVLVCDDDQRTRFILSSMLQSLGYKTLEASSAKECLEVVYHAKEDISLILLDDLMPEMTGRECFYELKKKGIEIKVVLITGYRQVESVLELQRDGLSGILHKPVTLEELSTTVYNFV